MGVDLVREGRRRWDLGEVLRQMDSLGVQSISVTNLTALFTGLVLALQTAYTLADFGGKLLIGRAVVLSLSRELGPTLTALMVAAVVLVVFAVDAIVVALVLQSLGHSFTNAEPVIIFFGRSCPRERHDPFFFGKAVAFSFKFR